MTPEKMTPERMRPAIKFWDGQRWRFCPDCQRNAFEFAAEFGEHVLAAYRATQSENTAREPHDGWMNAWIFENIPHDQSAFCLWNHFVRKMAGDWADFRLSHAYRATEEDAGKMTAQEFYELWRKSVLYHRVGKLEFKPEEAFQFAEAYHQYRTSQDERRKANPFYYPKEGDPQ